VCFSEEWKLNMTSGISERRICRFGLFEADLVAGTLKRNGLPLRIQEQPFRILCYLLERPGQIVTREELRARLWSEGTYVEFDGSLNTALMKLRAVLNDDPENPRFVETVPKKGYRFIAPVQFQESASPPVSVEVMTVPIGSSVSGVEGEQRAAVRARTEETAASRPVLFYLALLAAAALVLAAVLWAYWPPAVPQVLRVTQLTYSGRVDSTSEVVSDGARLYFVSREGGRQLLMATSIHGGSVERLASPFDNTMIFDLSPDRTQLLLGSAGNQGDPVALWIWPAHGGVPHRLGDAVASDAAWSPGGDMIAYTEGGQLFTIKKDGSSSRELQKLPGLLHSPAWSGDGQKIRFTVSDREKSTDEMWEAAVNGTGLRRVLQRAPSDLHLATGTWNADQHYFLFTAGADSPFDQVTHSVSNLWVSRETGGWFSRQKQPIQLTQGPIAFGFLTGSVDSNRFFAMGSHPELQLLRIDPHSSAMNMILPDAGVSDVDVTPNGEWLVYSLREGGALWKSRRDGKERVELTASSPGSLGPQWSPDEKEILFTAYFLAKQPQLYVVPSDGGTPRALLPEGSSGSVRSGDWSSDGKQILFDHFEHGVSDVRILERSSGKVETLPDSRDLVQPRWSPDGKHIAAIQSKTRDILVYAVDAKKWALLAETIDPQGMRWSAESNFVYYQEMADPEQAVFRVRLGKTTPEKVFGFANYLGLMASQCHFTGVAPDGSIYATVDRGGTDIYALDLRFP
jgi:Tol biopolymer transport system component/DNA-binding winged helix-turn-helix (wHTH) protein